MSDLTIVLPIKGRGDFTPRFLQHAGGFEVIQAHGGETLADYWAKMVDAIGQVRTPYAMVADNDDFLVRKGLLRCIQFLDGHPDFIACSGRIQGIWLYPNRLTGPYCHITRQYAPFDTPATYEQPSQYRRILAGFRNSWSFYAVYRTEALLQIWKDVAELDLKDLMVHEKFCAIRALSLGKVHCFAHTPSYLRQYETSTRNTNIIDDWSNRLQQGEWTNDMRKVLNFFQVPGLHQEWGKWYVNHLNYHFGWKGRLRRGAKALLPRLAYAYQHRHEYIPIKNRIGEIFL